MTETENNMPKATEHAAVMRRRNLVMLGVVLGLAVLFFVITIIKMSMA